MYDIIGDIHGHADELCELLETMGYTCDAGVYGHPDCKAVFVGDFIDRGPQIGEALHIVRRMVDTWRAYAVMGNHEFNAIAYHTPDPAEPGQFLRKHTEKNVRQHAQTVQQMTADDLREAILWFQTLPMWVDLDGIRIVHACWEPNGMSAIEKAIFDYGYLSLDFMRQATDDATPLFQAVEDVLKGKELRLPDGCSFRDKDGHERKHVRVRWFEHPSGKTFRQYALPPTDEIPSEPVPESAGDCITPYPAAEPPVFFGHYWLRADKPVRLARNVACLDYSVAKGGSLCAYRWDVELEVDAEKFVTVNARDAAH